MGLCIFCTIESEFKFVVRFLRFYNQISILY